MKPLGLPTSDEEVTLLPTDWTEAQRYLDLFERLYTERAADDTIRPHAREFFAAPPGIRLAVWCAVTGCGVDQIDKAKWMHRWMGEAVLDVFKVPIGEKGIGVKPARLIDHDEFFEQARQWRERRKA